MRYLYIKNFEFSKYFSIKLENIIKLYGKNCKNITISKNYSIKLEKLDFGDNETSNIDILEIVNLKN